MSALFDRATSFEGLFAAAGKAARGKRRRPDVARFMMDAERHCLALGRALRLPAGASAAWRPGRVHRFRIHDPKPRLISAVAFPDRVVHHALMSAVEPRFERYAVFDSYACRQGKGQLAAVRRAQRFARAGGWALKVDFAAYFASIPHGRLLRLARRRIRDRGLVAILERIVRDPGHAPEPDRGLPIGALTSQHLANLYLGQVDHWFKDERGVRRYLRYMDDLVAFGERAALRALLVDLRVFAEGLGLALNDRQTRLLPVRDGVPFLSFRVFGGVVRPRPATARRFRRAMVALAEAWADGEISQDELTAAVASRCSQLAHFDTFSLRSRAVLRTAEQGTGRERPQPGEPGRLVRRQSAERSGCQPKIDCRYAGLLPFTLDPHKWLTNIGLPR
ncbi:MAG: reverse transcriptase domain-containing protein [Thermoanaerobaculia bacterium]